MLQFAALEVERCDVPCAIRPVQMNAISIHCLANQKQSLKMQALHQELGE
jgi:hypothetical protein